LKFKHLTFLGFGLFCLCFYFCIFQEINTDDETWFLQVVNRVISGEVLYRDVFFGATPLSVYIAALFAKIFGSELIVMRAVLAIYFVCSIILSCLILKNFKVSNPFSPLFIASFFVLAHFQSTWGFSGYNGLAKVFFLASFYYAPRSLKISALFAGLCFCTKQNVGALAFLAVLGTAVVKRDSLKTISHTIGIFTLTIGLCLLPTVIQGGWESFINYVVLNKTRYLSAKHCSYFLIPSLWDSYSIFIFAAPFLLILSLFFAFPRLKKEKDWPILLIFLFAGLLTLYPRPDNIQKSLCIPLILISLRFFYSSFSLPIIIQYALRSWLPIALLFSIGSPWFQKGIRISHIKHFKYIALDNSLHEHWKTMRQKFSSGEKSCFFLSTHCGFYYLLFNLQNPSPFDYPVHPAFGLHGEKELVSAIEMHAIQKVFIEHEDWSNWKYISSDQKPYHLESYLNKNMEKRDFFMEKIENPIFQVLELKACDGRCSR